MQTALFHNFSSKPFTGYWDGKPKTFKPGEKVYLPEYLAKHYAKHLTNQILIEQGKERSTSPKFPEQVPDFINLFNKACIIEDSEEMTEAEVESDVMQKSHQKEPIQEPKRMGRPPKVRTIVDDKPPQIINSPDEEEFEGLKK